MCTTRGRILAAFTAACLQTHLASRQEKRVITIIIICALFCASPYQGVVCKFRISENCCPQVPRLVQTADESALSQRAAVEAVDAAHVQRERQAQEMQQEGTTGTLELPSAPGEFSVTVAERIICRMEPINVTKCTEQSAPGECSVTVPERIIRRWSLSILPSV